MGDVVGHNFSSSLFPPGLAGTGHTQTVLQGCSPGGSEGEQANSKARAPSYCLVADSPILEGR